MKLSVKLQDHHKSDRSPPLLLRGKVPITIFNQPFLSHFSTTTTHPSDLSLALSTNFSSGPSLKLSYATTSSAAAATSTPPLTLSLKSGTGIFGSPRNSPLIISAHFSFNPSNPSNPNPTFSLLFKPQLGSFSLRKSTCSHPKPDSSSSDSMNVDSGSDSNSFGFVSLESPVAVQDISLGKNEKYSILQGMQLTANTQIPMAKRAALNLRWNMDFPEDKMPILRINKIGIERVEQVIKESDERKSRSSTSEVEMLKGMCSWMQKELDSLTRVNKEMKYELAEIKGGCVARNGVDNVRKKVMPAVKSGFDQWKKKKNGVSDDENGNLSREKEDNKNGSLAMDVENELQRAIKAASSSP